MKSDNAAHPPPLSTFNIPPILLADRQAAALLGVGVRTFHSMRDEPWMARPIVLGPRLVRWSRSELEEAVLRMPRQGARSEPEELRRSRIERMKGNRATPILHDGGDA
jgi:predicted DNA-binding transcriptional regulator AlpA